MKDENNIWELRAKKYGKKAVGNLTDPLWDREENILRWTALKKSLKHIKGQKALDIGTGIGHFAIKLAKRGFIVSANDISPTLISIAKQRSIENKVNIDFFCCAIQDLPFPSNTFDVVLSVTVLQHILEVDDYKRSIKKIIDITKINGTIAIIEYSPKVLSGSFEQRSNKAEMMIPRTRDEWITDFENQGVRFYKEKGIRFFGYYQGKKRYLHYKNKILNKLGFRKDQSNDCSVLMCWIIFTLTILIDYILSQIPFFKDKADTRLLIFKKRSKE